MVSRPFQAQIIFVSDTARISPPIESLCRRGVESALRAGKARPAGALHVVWSSRDKVRALNRKFRRTARFTDVIAFRYDDPFQSLSRTVRKGPKAPPPFGDLYIAVPQARLNACRFGVPFQEEVARLAVHGTLHLLGYTDYTPRARKKMWAVQEDIVGRLAGYSSRSSGSVRRRT